jgi:hypothetical protein
MLSELYYRNKEGHVYADIDENKIEPYFIEENSKTQIHTNLPIFKNKQG